ncbi:sigma-54-dependent Fis family transcriptional regulator [bacterium]|nr:sigma-54-dependent Fis family transcriptional regulator [bacterium]
MRILVIDDGNDIYNFCSQFIREKVKCAHFTNYHDAHNFVKKSKVDVILVDKVFNIEEKDLINISKNHKIEGYAIAERIKKEHSEIPIIMISVHAPGETAQKTLELGIDDFIEWEALSLDPEILIRRIKKLLGAADPAESNKAKMEFKELGIVGNGKLMKSIMARVKKIAQEDTHILFTGETGVGKDMIANAVHYFSGRKDYPFIDLNLSAIPETLVEDEIFGHEKGAFTDAKAEKKSVLEIAGGGTVLFNEIGDLNLQVQVKILKLIESKAFTRIGGTKEIKTNARFIFATNKELKDMVARGLFRKDLYYRISTNVISIPPLRERKEDIPEIVYYAVKDRKKKITNDAIDYLKKQKWEGNIRQLKSVIESTAILCDKVITVRSIVSAHQQHILQPVDQFSGSVAGLDIELSSEMSLKDLEKAYIAKVLQNCDWFVEPAEKILKISRASLYRKIKEYDLKGKIRGYSQK